MVDISLRAVLDGKMYMINVRPNIKKIFEMTGVLKIIPIIESLEEVGGNRFEECI